MASWEDLADEPDVVEPVVSPTVQTTDKDSGKWSPSGGNASSLSSAQNAPPRPVVRGGMTDAPSISQAYNAAQPKMRILQRQPQANAQQRGQANSTQGGDADESAARLHANYEQKQRKYEADRKKLFDDAPAEEGAK